MKTLYSTSTVRMAEDGIGAGGGGGGAGTLLASAGVQPQEGLQNGADANGGTQAGGGAQEPFWAGWIASDGKLNKSRYDHLPDDLKDLRETLEKVPDLPSLFHKLHHLNTLAGKKGLLPLPANASDKDKAEFKERLRSILGVPAKPEEYGIKRPDEVPEEHWDGEFVNEVQKLAYEEGVSPQTLHRLVEMTNQRALANLQAQELARQEQLKQTETQLRQQWQGNYESNLRTAMLTAQTFGLDPDDPLLGNHPGVIQALAQIGQKLGNHNLVTDGDGSSDGGMSPMQRVDAIYKDPRDPLYAAIRDSRHPQYREAHAFVTKLLEQAEKMAKRKA